MNKEIEEKIVNAFFIKRKRERALYQMTFSDKKREDLLWAIESNDLLDSQYVLEIQRTPSFETIYNLLKGYGAPKECYVIGGEKDTEEVSLRDALKMVFGWGPSIISCIHGTLAYFEGHPNVGAPNRYILKK